MHGRASHIYRVVVIPSGACGAQDDVVARGHHAPSRVMKTGFWVAIPVPFGTRRRRGGSCCETVFLAAADLLMPLHRTMAMNQPTDCDLLFRLS